MIKTPILCRMAFSAPVIAGDEIQYMPGGINEITPSQGGKAVSVKVLVSRESADALEAQRAALAAKGKRPYFDFNHEDREASFWPEAFYWKDGTAPGVYARGEWSNQGREGIEGKAWRQFSPVFFVDNIRSNPARIISKPDAGPNMGGLVNDPAFHSILPFWAKDAAGAHTSNPNQTNNQNDMTPEELAALQAKNKQLETELADLRAKESALKAKNETDALVSAQLLAKEAELKASATTLELEQLRAKSATQEAAIKARNEKDADTAVNAAVARGAIPAKDEALKAKWKALIVENPANAELLAAQAGSPVLGGRVSASGAVVVGSTGVIDHVRSYNAIMARQAGAESMATKVAIAREAGALYCTELRGQIEDLPLVCDNSIGTAAGTLVTMRTLELLKFEFPLLSAITTDFSDQNANFNQTITTRTLSVPTIGTYSTSTGYAQTDQNAGDVSITINRHKFLQTSFNTNVLAGTMRRLFEEFAPASAYALAKDLVDALYALIIAGTYTETPTDVALVDFDRNALIDVATALDLVGVPQGSSNRSVLLTSTYFRKLEKESGTVLNAVTALAAFKNPEIITEGVLPNLDGFKVINAPNLPSTGNLTGFAFSKSAMALATRVPNDYTTVLPGASFGNVMVVTNPDTGLSVLQTQFVDHNLGSANQRIALMSGVAAGQVKAGHLIRSGA